MRHRSCLAALCSSVVLIAACGGGGGSTSDPASASSIAAAPVQTPTAGATVAVATGSTTTAPAVAAAAASAVSSTTGRAPQPADESLSFVDYGDTTTTANIQSVKREVLVATSTAEHSNSFDAPFTNLSPGWWINWWGTSPPTYVARQETRPAYVSSGTGSQLFRLNTVPGAGDANLVYSYNFAKDTPYTVSIKVRSDVTSSVRFQFRQNAFPYTELAVKTVDVTGTWQTVVLTATYPFADSGSLRVIPQTLGTDLYLDDLTITPTVLAPVTSATTKTAVAVGLDLPAQGATAVSLNTLKTYDMEGNYAGYAQGWSYNTYSGTSDGIGSVTRETRADHVHGGASSQKFQVLDKKGGAFDYISAYPFVRGKIYRASLWARADEPTPLQIYMRMDAHPWQPFASATVSLSTNWQRVEIEGTYTADVDGSLRIAFLNPTGTVWVDDVTISEVNKNELAPVSTAQVPDTLFGMHVNKLGVHSKWPGLGTKMIRLWDTGTTWRDLEKSNDVWDFARMDLYVQYVSRNDPQASIIYTMGMPPQWASTTPDVAGLYGPGSAGAPRDMNDWRDYVRTLARRYAGKIRYWELWNEPDYLPHYNGSTAQLVEMARIAREELQATDPNNKLLSPGYTVGQGIPALGAFLAAGGGQYVDIIGFHWYYSTNPEFIGPSMDNVRNTMNTYGVGSKPLWNTEGAFICDPSATDCATARPTIEQSRSVNARAMMVMAAKGIQNFNFHVWETEDSFGKLVESDFTTPTAAATAFAEARTWIKGASLIDAYHVDDKAYVFRFTRGSDSFVVLWSLKSGTLVNLPSAWNVTKVRTLTGNETTIGATRQLTLGIEPVMLKL